MSSLPLVSPDWLALREAADADARSRGLADGAAGVIPSGPLVVHDLGSGTGAMMRWLAPRLPGPQTWVLHDADAGILSHLGPEPVTDASGSAVSVRTSVEDLAELPADGLVGASLVTASALLDVVTSEEARAIVVACVAAGAPALFSLSVSGRVRFDPRHPLDRPLTDAFNDHQRRAAAGRRLLGPGAVEVLARLFIAAGWSVRVAETPWRLGPGSGELLSEWLDGWLDAAVEQGPELGDAAGEYRRRRRTQLADGRLHVTVEHRDLLAWPS
jgi:hypothetical protein